MNPLAAAAMPMLVAWLFSGAIDRIRRHRPEALHALSWSLAFGLIGAGWLVAILVTALRRGGMAGPDAAAGLCWLAASLLLVHGLRQRARRPDRAGVLAAIWGATALGMALLIDLAPEPVGAGAIIPMLEAAGLLLAIVAVRPFAHRRTVPDWTAMALLALLAAVKLVAVWLVIRSGVIAPVSTTTLAWAATPFYVALGLVAMLMLSQDQAAALHRLARIDALTGVWNRRGFDEAANYLIARMPPAVRASVAIADIDAFKSINDRYGHAIGDTALVRFAELLGDAVHQGDLLARLGGEEFALLAFHADGDALMERLERVRGLICLPSGDTAPTMTASFGIAQLCDETRSLRDALERADRALYRAKREGRNRSILGEAPMSVLG